MICRRAKVPRNEKINMEVTLLASTDIKRIKAQYLRDKEDRARKKLANKMSVVNFKALGSGTAELGTKEGIPSFSPTIHSSATPIPSIWAELTYDQPPFTRATSFTSDCLTKVADSWSIRVKSFVPKLVKVAIAKALRPFAEAKAMQSEINRAHNLRMDKLEFMIDDHSKELASLRERVVAAKKESGGSTNISAWKADIDELKKEVTSLWSIDFSTFFDGLEDPQLRIDVTIVPDERQNVGV